MRISSYIPAVAALLAAALLSVASAFLAVGKVESIARSQVARVLLADGQDWVDITVDGLLVVLSGTATDEATRFRALRLASTVVDSTRVIDDMTVPPAKAIEAPRFSIEILRNDAGISLIGLVPGAMDRNAVVTTITELAGGAAVTDLLESADYPVPGGWPQALSFALDALAQLPRSKISVAADRVEITAISDSGAEKRSLEASLASDAPDNVALTLNISAPRPVITPFTLRFLIDETGGRFDACSAHTEDGRARILAAAAAAGLQGKANCTLGLGVPSPSWPDAVTQAINALATLGGGALTFSDADISLVALDSTEQALFDRVVGELENTLPEVFSLEAVKPEPVKIDGTGDSEEGPPEFVATLSPEGLLQLRGRVSDARQRDAISGFSRARFSTAEVTPAMRLAEDLPDGWAQRVFAGLEAMSLLSNGSLVVQPEFLDIRGNTGFENGAAEVSRILSAQLGDGANFAIAVNYLETLDPEADLPTPEDCVDRINAVLAARKVTFAPGSADIEAGALATIDKIAEVMEDCSEVPMEIAGHTDSQGRETMNQQLSAERATAILTALQARRVLTGNLTPKGHGEASPIADNGTEEGREANRRIEFTLILPEADPEGEGEPTQDEAEDGQSPDEAAATDKPAAETEATSEAENEQN